MQHLYDMEYKLGALNMPRLPNGILFKIATQLRNQGMTFFSPPITTRLPDVEKLRAFNQSTKPSVTPLSLSDNQHMQKELEFAEERKTTFSSF